MKRRLLIAVAGLGALYLAVLGTYASGFVPPWVWWRYKRKEMSENTQGKRVVITAMERDRRANKRRADLWSAVWEASQTMSFDEIREHVEATLRDIESDQP